MTKTATERQTPQQQQNTPSTPLILLHSLLGERTTRRGYTVTNACHWFRTWIPSTTTTTTFAWSRLTTGTIFPLVLCRKVIPCFLVHPPHPCYKSDKKRVYNRASGSVCTFTRTYITCTSTKYVNVPEQSPSRPGTQSLVKCCCVAFSSAVIVSLPRVKSCVRLPRLYPCTYAPTEIQ